MENEEPIEVKSARDFVEWYDKFDLNISVVELIKRLEDLLKVYDRTTKIFESKIAEIISSRDNEKLGNINLWKEIQRLRSELIKYKNATNKAIEEKYPTVHVCLNCETFSRGDAPLEHKPGCAYLKPTSGYPRPVCSSYYLSYLSGNCTNCGNPKKEHN